LSDDWGLPGCGCSKGNTGVFIKYKHYLCTTIKQQNNKQNMNPAKKTSPNRQPFRTNIKYKIAAIVVGLLIHFNSQAEEIAGYFLSMPAKLSLPLDANKKKELILAYNESSAAAITNLLNDTVTLQQLTGNYLSLQSGIAQTEIALLTMTNHSQIICLIHTVCAPVCDSRIHFYTTGWEKLNTADFFVPEKASAFFRDTADEAAKLLINSLLSDISFMQYHIDPDDLSLIQTYLTPQYTDKETAQQIVPHLKQTARIFRWTTNRYE
jgi:hypothetical protein